MIRYRFRPRAFAVCLSALAGFTDAVGFMALGGYFVSFMSGNSTRLAVGLAERSHQAIMAGGLVAAFVGGVVAGSLIGRSISRRRSVVILLVVTVLLAMAAGMANRGAVGLGFVVVAAAMGAENTVFEREGEVSIGVTYMTGALVKFGQRLASALAGGEVFGWAPYFALWTGLISGAVAGAAAFAALGLQALWLAAGVAACLSGGAVWAGLDEDGA